jgi:hypothetical protein
MRAAMARASRFTLCFGILVAASCGGDDDGDGSSGDGSADAGESPDGGTADGPDAGIATRTVSGVMKLRHVTPDGVVDVPVDLTQADIAALIPPSFAVHPGSGDALGTFSIPDVPAGIYYLKIDDRYLVTSRDSVDLSSAILGRSAAVPATIPPTDLVLDVDNLAPWQPFGDELQMFSAGSGTVAFSLQNGASGGLPEEGNTALVGFTYDLSAAPHPFLVDGDAGDLLFVSQLALANDGVNLYRRVVRVFAPDPFTMVDGQASNLGGSFADVAETDTFAAEWDRPAFDAALRAGAPIDEIPSYPNLTLHALPAAAEHGFYHSSADIVQLAPGWTDDTSTVQASWDFGDPFPAAWTRMVSAGLLTYRYRGVGGAEPRPLYSSIGVNLPRSAVSAETAIAPVVGPVRSPQVAGHDAFESIDGIGTTPTVSWQPPALGTATRYLVVVTMLVDEEGFTRAYRVAFIDTTGTAVIIPPGILAPGGTYVFSIYALHEPWVDAEAEPNREVLPDAWAQIITEPDTI